MTSIILTGATGTAILTKALASPHISHVTVLARRPPAVQSNKLTTIILPSDEYPKGFEEIPPALVERLRGNEAVIWALGISQTQVSKDEFIRITYDYTMAGANALKALGSKDKPFRFVFMSGQSVSQSEQVGMFTPLFSQHKGHAERDLVALESDTFKTVNIRPGGIAPTPERRPQVPLLQRWGISAAKAVWPSGVIESTDLADACIELAAGRGWDARDPKEHTIENAALKRLAEAYQVSMAA